MENSDCREIRIAPFLKWAGGKRWLVTNHSEVFPAKYNTYIEPFLGSGAVYFHLMPRKAVLSDLNNELIGTYKALQNNWANVYRELSKHHKNHSKDYYYKVRKSKPKLEHTKAARFIYLNRTCWNGLYRVNLDGEFNVPIGTKNKVIMDNDDFLSVANLLSKARIKCADFESIIDKAKKDDFVFVDPPYTVTHNNNGFIKYNDKLFCNDDQIRLRDSLLDAANRGAHVVTTNADHKFVRELYGSYFNILRVKRSSVIAADRNNRGAYNELIISSV